MTGPFVLTIHALFELALYDVTNALFGFRRVCDLVVCGRHQSARQRAASPAVIFEAVNLAVCFYYKPVQCLQLSAVSVRLLRKYGIACDLVIGYRVSPFLAHAWLEIEGRVANDLPGYAKRLRALQRL